MTEPLGVRLDAATAAPASPVFVALRPSPGAKPPGGTGVVVVGVVGGGAAGVVGVGADEVLLVGGGLGDVDWVVGLLDGALLDDGVGVGVE